MNTYLMIRALAHLAARRRAPTLPVQVGHPPGSSLLGSGVWIYVIYLCIDIASDTCIGILPNFGGNRHLQHASRVARKEKKKLKIKQIKFDE